MKLKPYENSKELLGMTRAEAKMYEYSVPEENRIHINKEKIKDLFILTIALLGDYAANFYKEVDTENQLIDLKNNLDEDKFYSQSETMYKIERYLEDNGFRIINSSQSGGECVTKTDIWQKEY